MPAVGVALPAAVAVDVSVPEGVAVPLSVSVPVSDPVSLGGAVPSPVPSPVASEVPSPVPSPVPSEVPSFVASPVPVAVGGFPESLCEGVASGVSEPPGGRAVVQTDNGSRYISQEFKKVLSQNGRGHARSRPHCPERNGLAEPAHCTLGEPSDEAEPEDLAAGRMVFQGIIRLYNEDRLHSALLFLRLVKYTLVASRGSGWRSGGEGCQRRSTRLSRPFVPVRRKHLTGCQ